MFGRKRQEPHTDPKQPTPDPAAVARAQQKADALRQAARERKDIDPADAKYW